MDAATTALVQKWGTAGSFALAPSELRALDADVDWDEVVRFRSCLDGRAAVLTADAARGTQSRLLLRGFDQGTVKGDPGCPDSLTRIEPWGGV